MRLKGTKVLVTGASGFIGSHLTERLLQEEADVNVLLKYNSSNNLGRLSELPRKEKVKIYSGDLKNYDAIKEASKEAEIIFHLGALISIPYSYTDPREYFETNAIGTLNILQAARENNAKKVIITSTSEVYGTATYTPINEKHPLQAQSPYSASKISADKVAESFYLSYGLPVCIIRPFNSYGPRQSLRAIVPTIIFQALNGNTIKLGDLTPKRDFTYVLDTVNGFIKIAESDNHQIFGNPINIGTGKAVSIEELVLTIGDLMGKNLEVKLDSQKIRPKESEVKLLICDNSKAKDIIKWTPKVTLKEGLGRTIDYIKNNLEDYKNLWGAV